MTRCLQMNGKKKQKERDYQRLKEASEIYQLNAQVEFDPGFQHTNCKNFLKAFMTNGEAELWLEINLY